MRHAKMDYTALHYLLTVLFAEIYWLQSISHVLVLEFLGNRNIIYITEREKNLVLERVRVSRH